MSNILLAVDSYKLSHFPQYPSDVVAMHSHIEPRRNNSGLHRITGVTFGGLQRFVKKYLLKPITKYDIEELAAIAATHGEPCPTALFEKVLTTYGGYLPLTIRAVKEGTLVPFGNVLVTVECHDEELFWLASYIETALLRAVWYPTTVCTIDRHDKEVIWEYLVKTSDDPVGQLPVKLHDFGARGVSSGESAAIGGMAHLVNFMGTDTMEALIEARRYYNAPMAGFSIPASEHSTMTSWGREHEVDAYRNMIKQFSKPGSLYACVSDSYDVFNAAENLWGGELKEEVISGGGMLVVRPDSGDPIDTPIRIIHTLAKKFGTTRNSKGYEVLNHVRVIQGDGVDSESIRSILLGLELRGYSADNIAFGKGGAMLQKVDRDTFSFAQKCSAVGLKDGTWRDVYKDPIGGGKTSKKGRLALVHGTESVLEHGEYVERPTLKTIRLEELGDRENLLEVVYDKGQLLRDQTFDEIRAIAGASFVLP
jgi:nicotinamide phosphoribosyltransferase